MRSKLPLLAAPIGVAGLGCAGEARPGKVVALLTLEALSHTVRDASGTHLPFDDRAVARRSLQLLCVS
jgi:hypothetical protein